MIDLPPSVQLFDMRVTLTQDADSCQSGDLGQSLTITVENAGGGPYAVLKTDRWAINKDEIEVYSGLIRQLVDMCEEKENPPGQAAGHVTT